MNKKDILDKINKHNKKINKEDRDLKEELKNNEKIEDYIQSLFMEKYSVYFLPIAFLIAIPTSIFILSSPWLDGIDRFCISILILTILTFTLKQFLINKIKKSEGLIIKITQSGSKN